MRSRRFWHSCSSAFDPDFAYAGARRPALGPPAGGVGRTRAPLRAPRRRLGRLLRRRPRRAPAAALPGVAARPRRGADRRRSRASSSSLKLERAQSALDLRRAAASLADAFEGEFARAQAEAAGGAARRRGAPRPGRDGEGARGAARAARAGAAQCAGRADPHRADPLLAGACGERGRAVRLVRSAQPPLETTASALPRRRASGQRVGSRSPRSSRTRGRACCRPRRRRTRRSRERSARRGRLLKAAREVPTVAECLGVDAEEPVVRRVAQKQATDERDDVLHVEHVGRSKERARGHRDLDEGEDASRAKNAGDQQRQLPLLRPAERLEAEGRDDGVERSRLQLAGEDVLRANRDGEARPAGRTPHHLPGDVDGDHLGFPADVTSQRPPELTLTRHEIGDSEHRCRERQPCDRLVPPAHGEAERRNEIHGAVGSGHLVEQGANRLGLVARFGCQLRLASLA